MCGECRDLERPCRVPMFPFKVSVHNTISLVIQMSVSENRVISHSSFCFNKVCDVFNSNFSFPLFCDCVCLIAPLESQPKRYLIDIISGC